MNKIEKNIGEICQKSLEPLLSYIPDFVKSKTKQENTQLHLQKNKIDFASMLKKNTSNENVENNEHSTKGEMIKDINLTLIIKNCENLKSDIEIRNVIGKNYPKLKLLSSTPSKSSQSAFLKFSDVDSFSEFFDKFDFNHFGKNSSVHKYCKSYLPENNAVILRNIPIDVIDADINNAVVKDYPIQVYKR